MISAIFTALSEVINNFATSITQVFTSAIALFYTPGSGSTAGTLTPLGTFALIGLGTGLLMWGFHYVRSLIRVRTK